MSEFQKRAVGFNPRIRKGCDTGCTLLMARSNGFNPRIRKGCDYLTPTELAAPPVSIHASVKDAT